MDEVDRVSKQYLQVYTHFHGFVLSTVTFTVVILKATITPVSLSCSPRSYLTGTKGSSLSYSR